MPDTNKLVKTKVKIFRKIGAESEEFVVSEKYTGLVVKVCPLGGEFSERYYIKFDDEVGFVCDISQKNYNRFVVIIRNREITTITRNMTYKAILLKNTIEVADE